MTSEIDLQELCNYVAPKLEQYIRDINAIIDPPNYHATFLYMQLQDAKHALERINNLAGRDYEWSARSEVRDDGV